MKSGDELEESKPVRYAKYAKPGDKSPYIDTCPECGHNEFITTEDYKWHFIKCQECRFTTPEFKTEAEAADYWNITSRTRYGQPQYPSSKAEFNRAIVDRFDRIIELLEKQSS